MSTDKKQIRLKPSPWSPNDRLGHLSGLQNHPGWPIFLHEWQEAVMDKLRDEAMNPETDKDKREHMVHAYDHLKKSSPEKVIKAAMGLAETEAQRVRTAMEG